MPAHAVFVTVKLLIKLCSHTKHIVMQEITINSLKVRGLHLSEHTSALFQTLSKVTYTEFLSDSLKIQIILAKRLYEVTTNEKMTIVLKY